MALLRPKEIRAMRPDDMKAKFKELNDELMHERGIAAMGGAPASPGKIRAIRTNIARIHTIMRELGIEGGKAPSTAKPVKAEQKAAEKKAKKEKPKKEKAEKPKKEETK